MEKKKQVQGGKAVKAIGKKGNVLEWFYIIPALFMAVVAIIIASLIINTVDTTGVFSDTQLAQDAIDTTKNTILNFDNFFMFIIIGLSIAVIVGSAMVFHHPAFFIASTILLFIAVVVSAIASNTIWTFLNIDAISATAANFPKIAFLMDNLPQYIAVLGVVGMILMYSSYTRQ